MIWSTAAMPGAALRVMRTAVGRRVLQVALLVGGLFVLGAVFGGQAQAVDGVPGKPVSLGKPGIPAVASVVKPVPVPVPVLAPVLAPVSDAVERVVRPVSDVVAKTVTAVLAEVPSLPAVPTLPSLPAVPSLPVPPVQAPPAHTAPTPVPAPVPVRSAPQASSGGHRSDARHAEAAVGVGVTYGPRIVAAVDAVGAVRHAALHGVPSVGHTPVPQAPDGGRDGAPRNQSALDNGTSRHCDAHAVSLDIRVAVRFVPGVVACAGVAEARDRYRDVPVFPG
ncbi:hypothetical protein OG223_32245 [Streptomyces sp. NBC_01478]|uniref:hypothetical protein n=1 Tax=Streptomyces sp. NBC_01478 TaxID=2903882 RepID=UPI002E2FDFF9|nr:hypothetical protein [Streptomyces sp. NBC_01478]